MNPLSLTMVLGPYDHVRDVTDGTVPVAGVSLRTFKLPIEETFYRFTMHREWDVSEMSMGKYISFVSRNDKSVMALPVFVSRAFRHSMFYVQAGSNIKRTEDLHGKKIGVPEWAQTAGIYARGYMSDYLGMDLKKIQWIQAGVNEAGRIEKVPLKLPEGMYYQNVADKSLNEMLLAGELDAIITARPPSGLGNGIVRLMPNYQPLEEQYFKDTSIYPIMHSMVIKGSVLDEHPWVAMNLYKAFLQAKEQSVERMREITASHAPLAWLTEYTERISVCIGEDLFPYGLGNTRGGDVNRKTLSAFCRYGFEQGVCYRPLDVEELFHPNVLTSFKV
jgi:4,5-dihydroxyphthalate decarboxylase